jgi:hypothetical protein
MSWIRTVRLDGAEERLLEALEAQHGLYPAAYTAALPHVDARVPSVVDWQPPSTFVSHPIGNLVYRKYQQDDPHTRTRAASRPGRPQSAARVRVA